MFERKHNTFDVKEIHKTRYSFHCLQTFTEHKQDKNSKGKKGTMQ